MISVVEKMRKFVFIAIDQDRAVIWNEGLDSLNPPIRIAAPAQINLGLESQNLSNDYFEEVASLLNDGKSIVIMGHGEDRTNYGLRLIDHLKENHPAIASRVIDQLSVNVSELSVHELEAHARGWFEKNYQKFGSWHRRKADRRFT
jgi:hypothetical protein